MNAIVIAADRIQNHFTSAIITMIAALSIFQVADAQPHAASGALLSDNSGGDNWPAYGRTYGEQHYSPLAEIDTKNVSRLGLAWYFDLGPGNSATVPIAVDGVLYFASGLSVVHAMHARSGKLLWKYDPHVAEAAGRKLRQGWGSRGIGYWDGKVYVATGDGRLIALDAKNGTAVWSVLTVDRNDGRYITGAPRLFDGKVIIGHAGADTSDVRGYVTTYDARTGRQLWRFYIVPGNPVDGFEDEIQARAAKRWSGEWWKYGGGGTAWNAFTYDVETNSVFVGTGNGAPWNHKIRSAGKGDNLFLCSIVALDASTGKYKWHYQINPGESWDYNAAMDMHLADLKIDGTPRKVLIQAPKNGFLYVLDRITGKLISAEKIAKVNWATKIDLDTGRPVEVPAARYLNGQSFENWPGEIGAHSWMPSAYSPKAGLMFIPLIERGEILSDQGIDQARWRRLPGNAGDIGVNVSAAIDDPLQGTGWLLAVNPADQTTRWRISRQAMWNGGLMATAGDLLFQGTASGTFEAHDTATGRELWKFETQAPILGAPITYRVDGRQYISVLTGLSLSAAMYGQTFQTPVDYRTQARRVLTFALDGAATLPAARIEKIVAADDPDYQPDSALEMQGYVVYMHRCANCHGLDAVAGGAAPDLRASPVPPSREAFDVILRQGARVPLGMPRYEEISEEEFASIRQYIRSRAARLRQAK